MTRDILIKYFPPALLVGLQDIRNAWYLENEPVKMLTELHQGALAYRFPYKLPYPEKKIDKT